MLPVLESLLDIHTRRGVTNTGAMAIIGALDQGQEQFCAALAQATHARLANPTGQPSVMTVDCLDANDAKVATLFDEVEGELRPEVLRQLAASGSVIWFRGLEDSPDGSLQSRAPRLARAIHSFLEERRPADLRVPVILDFTADPDGEDPNEVLARATDAKTLESLAGIARFNTLAELDTTDPILNYADEALAELLGERELNVSVRFSTDARELLGRVLNTPHFPLERLGTRLERMIVDPIRDHESIPQGSLVRVDVMPPYDDGEDADALVEAMHQQVVAPDVYRDVSVFSVVAEAIVADEKQMDLLLNVIDGFVALLREFDENAGDVAGDRIDAVNTSGQMEAAASELLQICSDSLRTSRGEISSTQVERGGRVAEEIRDALAEGHWQKWLPADAEPAELSSILDSLAQLNAASDWSLKAQLTAFVEAVKRIERAPENEQKLEQMVEIYEKLSGDPSKVESDADQFSTIILKHCGYDYFSDEARAIGRDIAEKLSGEGAAVSVAPGADPLQGPVETLLQEPSDSAAWLAEILRRTLGPDACTEVVAKAAAPDTQDMPESLQALEALLHASIALREASPLPLKDTGREPAFRGIIEGLESVAAAIRAHPNVADPLSLQDAKHEIQELRGALDALPFDTDAALNGLVEGFGSAERLKDALQSTFAEVALAAARGEPTQVEAAQAAVESLKLKVFV
ncbi:MAG: hypothetical protein AAFX94_00395 [Myxococcota bacterium]